ncbi:MAG: signal peptidase I [Actinomycetes bacterium]
MVDDAAAARRRDDDGGESVLAFLRELPVLLLVAFFLAFLLRTFVVQVFYIPSKSMEPTLQVDDRMVVEKLTYLVREPERGDVVVFEGDEGVVVPDTGPVARGIRVVGQFLGVVPANARDFVKRVIGLPGDEVVITDGTVFVNGQAIDEPYVVFPDGRSYGPFNVPADSYFVLGDNRPNSSDSRISLGYVEREDIVGRALVIIWPFEHAGGIGHPPYGDIPPPPGDTGAVEDRAEVVTPTP